MSAINDLVNQIENPELRQRIQQEVAKMSKQKKFGLVFEEHLPENTPLYELPIRKGLRVAKRDGDIRDNYRVISIKDGIAECEHLDEGHEHVSFPVEDIIAVAQFGEPIYPYLKPMDSICNAPDSELWHTLIEADNYHALQLLIYLYGGKVDCIYIDPPYNTGNRDWAYNNDYIGDKDEYKHSKWLSFMKKRLLLAKKLLNPKDSVLIVTIDEKEYLHLGCLLEDLFPESNTQMITTVISPGGRGKKKGTDFTRTQEYIFYVRFGNCVVLPEVRQEDVIPLSWRGLIRGTLANGRGKHGVGACGPNQFYPIYVNNRTKMIQKIGSPIKEDVDRFSVPQEEGCTAVFPVRPDGTEMNWGCVPDEAQNKLDHGYLRVSSYQPNKPQQYVIQYLTKGSIADIESGKVIIEGKKDDGSVVGYYPSGKPMLPNTVWNNPSHNATSNGTDLLKNILGQQRLDYPKSLYAVRDCLKHVILNKKNALILDFFAGSGTTLHAVNLLNAEDGGKRRCIIVTNNEVNPAEKRDYLFDSGLKPGDDKWEAQGVARYVTWPRTKCSILGRDVNNLPIVGNYIGSNIPMAEGFKANANFFKLGFLDKTAVSLGRQFKELLPVLWMKAGARGECPSLKADELPDMLICEKNHFAVLINEYAYPEFEKKMKEATGIDVVYIITDSDSGYKEMALGLQIETCYQLYRDYLDNFRINNIR